MNSRLQKEKEKKNQDKYQAILTRLLREEDNKYCADCDAKGPRWTSWNLGLFVCIRCAGIHRNLGVHISKVKSVNLDSWTGDQVCSMENVGNRKAREVYEANLPQPFRRPQSDSSLEHFIRCKYEKKQYMDKSYVPKPITTEASAASPAKNTSTLVSVKHDDKLDESEKDRKKRERRARSSSITLPKPAEASSVPRPQASAANLPVLQPAQQNKSTTQQIISTSPKTASPLSTSPPVQQKQSAAVDLLGLDTPASNVDLFTMPTTTTPLTSSSKQDLFQQKENQDPVPTLFDPAPPAKEEEEKSLENPKNSKDSIMALYGSSSSQQTMYNVPGGLYIPQSSSSHSISNGPISTSSSTTTNAMMFGQQSQPHSQMQQQPQPLPQQQPQPQSATAAMSNMMGYGMMTQQPVYNAQQQQYMHQQYQLQLQLQLQQQQQQYQMQQYQQQQLQMQQVQQVQQQMQALRVGGGGSTAGVPAQMGWQQPTQGLQPGISAAAGAGGWGAMTGSGQTLSTQLWK